MIAAYETSLRQMARTLSEIGNTLASADDAPERLRRVLALTGDLVPNLRCALLKASAEGELEIFVFPDATPGHCDRLQQTMGRVLRLVSHTEEVAPVAPAERHLTLPLIGLDEVVGIVRLEPPQDVQYDAQHVRLLSVVAAQLGAYLAMIRLREQETRRTRELASAHDFQQLLVGVVSHDLRNPLAVVITVAEGLLRKNLDPLKTKPLERALRNARRANRIINDLLDVTHARVSGGMSIHPKAVELDGVLLDVVADVRVANPDREIFLERDEQSTNNGFWDADRMTQATTNLVANALQHGDPKAPVTVRLSAADEDVVIEVHNRGRPIPQEKLSALFNPFMQERPDVRRLGGGLGLGLYIVDQIVTSHGGRVTVRSTEAEGTSFFVTLPRRAAVSGHQPYKAAREKSAGALVLIVDDDQVVRDGVAELLTLAGYRPVQASNGEEALLLLRGGLKPALILSDLNMPVMDGESFCSALAQDPALSQIPIFIISADAATAVRFGRSGVAGFFEKPVRPARLLRAVEQLAQLADD